MARLKFTEDDMKEIMNCWRNGPEGWMNPGNVFKLAKLTGCQRHDFVKSRFGAMKFQLLGNETLVDHIIRCNLCGAAQPEMLTDFCERWERYTQTDLYLKARRESEKHEPGHVRRAKKLWHLKPKLKCAHWIADWIAEK